MEDIVLNRSLTAKYLDYLIQYSEQLIAGHTFTDVDYESFQKEFELFVCRLRNTPGIDRQLMADIGGSSLLHRESEEDDFAAQGFLSYLLGRGLFSSIAGQNRKQRQMKEELHEIRNRLSGILFDLHKYTFTN